MAAVVGLNGQAETFVSLNNTLTNDDRQRQVLLRVNEVLTLDDGCSAAKACPLTDNGSSKRIVDVIPDPGYVIKALGIGNGTKVFVNVCQKESIEKPSLDKQIARGGRLGSSWTIPHTLTEQVSNGSASQCSQTCRVFDFLVHPDACRMAETNNRFKHMLSELAVNTVAREFLFNLNVRKLQFPKMKYKTVRVISRKNSAQVQQSSSGIEPEASHKRNMLNFYKEQNTELSVKKSEMPDQEKASVADIDANNNKFTAPQYTVKFLDGEKMPVVHGVTVPQVLVVDIELPLVNSALAVNLDLFERSLGLSSTGPVRYKLEIDLPCVIDENRSCAKFVKSRGVLHVRMPVLITSSTSTSSSESVSDPASKSDSDHLEERQFSQCACLSKHLDSQGVEQNETESKDELVPSTRQKPTERAEDVSSEVVVVHDKVVPKLHGILKQRTISESSDDGVRACVSASERHASTTTGSEGDEQEGSPDRSTGGRRVLKKSVSFNDHVDHTVYQANQSVSSMHAALKNRRRRARKRDQKQEQREQRRRRRNSGSFSLEESGDELNTCVQATHIHAAGSQASRVPSSDEADHSTNIISDDYQDSEVMLGSEHASGIEQVHEDDKSSEGVLQDILTSDETTNENYNYSDTFRTKSSVLDSGSDEVSNGHCGVSSAEVFETCESEPSSVGMMLANNESMSDPNISQPAAFSSCEPLKSHQSTVSVAAPPCQSSENVTVLNVCCPFELDVD